MDNNFRYVFDKEYDKSHKQGLWEEDYRGRTVIQRSAIARNRQAQEADEEREENLKHMCPHCHLLMIKRGSFYECDFCGHTEVDKNTHKSPLADLDDDIKARLHKYITIK